MSDVAAALSGLLAEIGSYPEGEIASFGETAARPEAYGETAAPYGEDPGMMPQEDPAGILEAIAEPILLVDLWGEDLTRAEAESAVRSLTAYRDAYGADLDGVIAMLSGYAEGLPGAPGETGA